VAYGPYETRDDREIEAIEASQPPGTRMLIAIRLPFRFPGFGTLADAADKAVKAIAGLETWPELDRVVIADDVDPVWWVCYRSSPVWWLFIVRWLVYFLIGWAVWETLWRFVYVVLGYEEPPRRPAPPAPPDLFRTILDFIETAVPLFMIGIAFYFLWPMLREAVKRE